jgi:hypothetical protein
MKRAIFLLTFTLLASLSAEARMFYVASFYVQMDYASLMGNTMAITPSLGYRGEVRISDDHEFCKIIWGKEIRDCKITGTGDNPTIELDTDYLQFIASDISKSSSSNDKIAASMDRLVTRLTGPVNLNWGTPTTFYQQFDDSEPEAFHIWVSPSVGWRKL